MNVLQQWKQLELNLPRIPIGNPERSSEAVIAARLGDSPAGQVRLKESILERTNKIKSTGKILCLVCLLDVTPALDQPNRHLGTRMSGGVGGPLSDERSYPDRFQVWISHRSEIQN